MLVNDLRSEIDARLLASQPEIIGLALERIFREISEMADRNRAIDERGSCSYSVHYNVYQNLRTRLTHLWQMMAFDVNTMTYAKLEKRWWETSKVVDSLRPLRYTNICKKCPACLSRRKQWPMTTNFIYHVPRAIYADI